MQIQRAGGRPTRMRRRATSRRLRPPLTSGRDLAAVWVPTVAGMHRGQHELGPSSLSRCSRWWWRDRVGRTQRVVIDGIKELIDEGQREGTMREGNDRYLQPDVARAGRVPSE
jgi:hypothetical protein